ncbi:cohesin domain-containing protein [Paenibacillus contaminans]|nr:cohesin domain-containing protein [Paenibacillus contaminans]
MAKNLARKIVFICLAVLMAAGTLIANPIPASAATADANLMQNAGFESGTLDSWSTITAEITNVPANVRSGTYAAKITQLGEQVNQVVTGLLPNTKYKLTGYAKMDSGATFIGVNSYGGEILAETLVGNSYTKGTVIFTTGESNTFARVFCYRPSGDTGSAYCDDFSLEEVPDVVTNVPNVFPIGLFWPPGPNDTTDERYKEMREMNANFFIGNNYVVSPEANDKALRLAEANDFKIMVNDSRFAVDFYNVPQTAGGGTLSVSDSQPIGQTFKVKREDLDTGWYIESVKLFVDPASPWDPGTILTLSIYDSPAKQTLLNSITSNSRDGAFPIGNIPIGLNQSYYMEVTSNSSTPVNLSASTSDVYNDGEAYRNGVPEHADLTFDITYFQLVYADGARLRPSDASLDAITETYKDYEATKGYYLLDEPSSNFYPKLQEATKRLKANDPDHMVFVNLLPNFATPGQLGFENYTASEPLTSQQSLGQTFTTMPGQTHISTVQIWVDQQTWNEGEEVTLKLWDSPAKTNLIAGGSRMGANSNWPQFNLDTDVQENTLYYMEFTVEGNASIDGVVRSKIGDNWINDGTAYRDGSLIDADLWFTFDQNIQGGTYEDYVSRWVSTQPDVLSFDFYPYANGSEFREGYYANLEIIRNHSLSAGIDFWSYMQSVGHNWQRVPNESEMRYQVYTNLVYGAKGYMWYTYFTPAGHNNGLILPDGTRNNSYYWAKDIDAEVQYLGSTLLKLTSKEVYHTGSTIPDSTKALPANFFWQQIGDQPAVIGYFTHENGRKYVMVVNNDYQNSQTLSFQLSPGIHTVTEVSKTTGAEVSTNYNSTTGTLSDSFEPGEGRLYALDASFADTLTTAIDMDLTTTAGTALNGTLSANASSGGPLLYSIETNGTKGTVTLTNPTTGAFRYTPFHGAAGTDTFTFKANDGITDSNIGKVSVTISSEPAAISTSLTAERSSVPAGTEFKVSYGLNNVTGAVYGQDIKLDYDPAVMEFVSARSLLEGLALVEIVKEPAGKLRLIVASQGSEHAIVSSGQAIELTFRAKNISQTATGVVSITSAALGNDQGNEILAALSSISIQITTGDTGGHSTDINQDGKVTIGDLSIMAAHYGKDSSSPDWQQVKKADINGDGKIDILDLAAVAKKIVE